MVVRAVEKRPENAVSEDEKREHQFVLEERGGYGVREADLGQSTFGF